MTRDFAKKKRPPSSNTRRTSSRKPEAKPQKSLPGWLWLLSGAVIGAFAMFLVYLSGVAPSKTDTTDNKVVTTPPPAQPKVQPKPEVVQTKPEEDSPKPRLEFYKLLKESEVEVDTTAPPIQPGKTTAQENIEYLLQAGSFQKLTDADRMRAELILMNLDVAVEKVTLENKQVWHRVIVGPFDNRSQMASARATLVSNDISPLLIKRPK